MHDPFANFTDRLRKAMESAGITQSKLASLIGTSQPAVSQWLSGKKEPTDQNLADISRHLRVRREWLESGIPPMRSSDPAADREAYLENAGWGFREAPADGGRDYGNANVWSFNPDLEVLVREVLQNAKDAATSPNAKVEVTFRIVTLTGTDFKAFRQALKWDDLRAHLDASAKGKQKFNTILRDGLDQLDAKDELVLLVIEDTGTTGLTGPETGTGHFTALCRNNLDSTKDAAGAGGAFGLGKAVLWRASRLSTVLFGSNLATPQDGKTQHRVFGRCELAWHMPAKVPFAGPGWFGRLVEDEKAQRSANSYWENGTLAEDLYLGREGSGTTTCVLGFHDASADTDRKPIELAQELIRAAAVNFFPALVAGKLGVRVEVYDSGKQYRDRKPGFSQPVKPEDHVPEAVRMLTAYRDEETTERLNSDTAVAVREVTLTVPKRTVDPKHAEQEHKAVLLVTPADEDGGNDNPTNRLALFRGPGMVVQFKSLAGSTLGARPFHALLLCGRAPDLTAPDSIPANPQADQAAENFLRTAEPPSHNQWTATPDLKTAYARGCKSRLEEFLKAVTDAVRELVRPVPPDTGDGPNALKELFRIGPEPSGGRPDEPRVIESQGTVDTDGRWHVTARIRLKPRKSHSRLTPAVFFLAETGTGTPVKWESLSAERGCETKGLTLVVPPDTREVRFGGVTDPESHPIPAADSCVIVGVKKFVDLKGGVA